MWGRAAQAAQNFEAVASMLRQPLRSTALASAPSQPLAATGPCLAAAGWRQGAYVKRQEQQLRRLAGAAAGDRVPRSFRHAPPGLAGGAQSQQQQHPQHSPPVAPVEPSVLASRRWLLQKLPLQQFKAVGVSFEGRQELIPPLRKDQGVALVREPDNPHDPHAVAIRSLDGAHTLGYVARDKTFHFLQDLCFGAVGSVGQAGEEGLWGFNVLVQPTVPPVEVHAFPASLLPHVSLGLHLQGPAWAALKQRVLDAAGRRCDVTAAPLATVHERWAFDDAARVLRLLGFRAEAPEVQQVGGLLALQEQVAGEAEELLRQLNCWSDDADVAAYLAGVCQLERQRSAAGPWRLDLGWLHEQGVEVPAELRSLCV